MHTPTFPAASRVTAVTHSVDRSPLPAGGAVDAAASKPSPGAVRRLGRASGFTLLELLVVMVILGLLAGYVGPRYFGQIGKSEVKAARTQLEALAKSLDQYRLDTGRYPTTEQGLVALNARPGNEPKWDGPYLSKALPNDPWGRPYQYRSPGEQGEFDLFSFGRDGQPGGTDDGADLTYR